MESSRRVLVASAGKKSDLVWKQAGGKFLSVGVISRSDLSLEVVGHDA